MTTDIVFNRLFFPINIKSLFLRVFEARKFYMRLVLCVSLFLFTIGLSAQREAANWYFGNNAGLDFNSGSPTILDDGQLDTLEGCESFSDADGNLLFYTDGKTVWNRFHQIMNNGEGLKGSFSTTQSALVVPNPDQPNIYYIFTPDDVLAYGLGLNGESNGFNYSVIDMSLDGGRGSIIMKNVDLLDHAAENVTAVLNFDTNEYWVVTHYMDSIYSYRVDGSGVATSPVISNIGPALDDFRNYRGAIKISPDGTKLSIAHTIIEPEFKGAVYLYDFDVATGSVSNPLLLSTDRLYYGVEFSSNSTKLYASGLLLTVDGQEIGTGAVEIVQFDLKVSTIIGSLYVASSYERLLPGTISGALQIGIDKKIYHSLPNAKLSVIRTPNLEGINCDFRAYSIDLGDASASYGLPPFIQSFFETIVTIENFCESDSTSFTIDDTANIQSVQWNFGDPNSGSNNLSSAIDPTHVFSSPGIYTVTMNVNYLNGSSRGFTEFVEIAEVPQVNNSVELIQCDIDDSDDGLSLFNLNEANALFNNGNENIKGFFFATLTDAVGNKNHLEAGAYANTSNGQVIYARAFENAECFSIVEVTLTVKLVSDLGLYGTIPVCLVSSGGFFIEVDTNSTYDQLEADFGSGSVQLYTSADDALLEQDLLDRGLYIFQFDDEIVYYFRIENDNDCDFIGRLELNVIPKPEYEEQLRTTLCNSQAELIAPDGFEQYTWSTGETDETISVTAVGDYNVTFTNQTCSYTQNFTVLESPEIGIEEIKINDFSTDNEIIVNVSEDVEQGILYSIDDGLSFQESNLFQNLTPGVYGILITNDCTELRETVVIGGVDSFFTPNNDGINDIWTLGNAEYFPNFSISIYDRYGKLMKSFQEARDGWDGTFLERQMPSADYWYKLNLEGDRVVTGHFALKR